MVGMLQIIIMMGCVYLVMKAIAIAQTGLAAREDNRTKATFYTLIGTIIGIGGAALALYMMAEQAAVISGIGTAPY